MSCDDNMCEGPPDNLRRNSDVEQPTDAINGLTGGASEQGEESMQEFVDFVLSFPLHQLLPPPQHSDNKVGLDHLDNLCRLMEQLGELREANGQLRRRVQYLEDVRALHEIHREMHEHRPPSPAPDLPQPIPLARSKTTHQMGGAPAETMHPVAGELYRSRTSARVCGHRSRSATGSQERRERSKSVGGLAGGKKRPSRWSRVKEALGIERNPEEVQQHPYPLACSKSHSSVLSSKSFSDHRPPPVTILAVKKCGTMDAKAAQAALESFEKEMAKKSPKTAWGKMKTMIQIRRDHRQHKGENSSSSSPRDAKPSLSKSPTDLVPESHSPGRPPRKERGTPRRSPFLEGGDNLSSRSSSRAQNGMEGSSGLRKSPNKPQSKKLSLQHPPSESERSHKSSRREESEVMLESCEGYRENTKRKKSKHRPPPLEYSGADQPGVEGLSPQTQRRWVWTKMKDILKGKREGEGPFSRSAPSSPASPPPPPGTTTFDFDVAKVAVECQAGVSDLLRDLQQNLSEDFTRKLEEWQRCKNEVDSIAKRPPEKDPGWLQEEQRRVETQLEQVEGERLRLEGELQRLQQLRGKAGGETVRVRTSAGEFRFAGLSEGFARKLFEWETRRGVVSPPEMSTIALLTDTDPSRASSEPDLSAVQKEQQQNSTFRSKSGDTLLGAEGGECASGQRHSEESYYSLLEENMFLLDALKEKEAICDRLQRDLDRLDERARHHDRGHQEEMEKYRQKLWEIHMSRPRDLQGSLHLISELKSRIDELQKCSDKLKLDREKLEESFRYHSNQQARLADDLIRKVREMQFSGPSLSLGRGGPRRKWHRTMSADTNSINKIHELSTKLLQQARCVEARLLERARQVCALRWEVLQRDMSAVLLQAALHRVTSGPPPAADRRRKFAALKAWSVDERPPHSQETWGCDEWVRDRLRGVAREWPPVDCSPADLMATAHDIKRETLRLALQQHTDRISDSEDKKSATCSADSEMADSDRCYDTGSALNSRSSSFSSGCMGGGGLRGCRSDPRLHDRRGSSSSADSSSLDGQTRPLRLRARWRSLDNLSSSCSSRSSILEEESRWRGVRPGSGGSALVTPRALFLSRISDTDDSDKSLPASLGRTADVHTMQPLPYSIERREGSMESLDKYETAIRDEDLLPAETGYPIPQTKHSDSQQPCSSRDIQAGWSSDASTQSSAPNSPSIANLRYKGTKGFGRPYKFPREEKAATIKTLPEKMDS